MPEFALSPKSKRAKEQRAMCRIALLLKSKRAKRAKEQCALLATKEQCAILAILLFSAIFAILGHFLTFPQIFLTLDLKMIKINRYLVTKYLSN